MKWRNRFTPTPVIYKIILIQTKGAWPNTPPTLRNRYDVKACRTDAYFIRCKQMVRGRVLKWEVLIYIYYINITNYISSIIIQTTPALAFGHECPTLLIDVHLIDWNPVNHCYVHNISSSTWHRLTRFREVAPPFVQIPKINWARTTVTFPIDDLYNVLAPTLNIYPTIFFFIHSK